MAFSGFFITLAGLIGVALLLGALARGKGRIGPVLTSVATIVVVVAFIIDPSLFENGAHVVSDLLSFLFSKAKP